MKKLYILRHAKSSWASGATSDFDRPLNKRGLNDAPFMGKKFKEFGVKPDCVISSAALRAITTARMVCFELNFPEETIVEAQGLYLASVPAITSVINQFKDAFNAVMLVGHNPGLTELANYLSDIDLLNLPTCALVEISFDVESWAAVSYKLGRCTRYTYPKQFQ